MRFHRKHLAQSRLSQKRENRLKRPQVLSRENPFGLFKVVDPFDCPFPVAAVRVWNSLLQHVTSAPSSLSVFRSRLNTTQNG